jgi:aryl-alcohol dehydrogenase-like predicted oxidoreductase
MASGALEPQKGRGGRCGRGEAENAQGAGESEKSRGARESEEIQSQEALTVERRRLGASGLDVPVLSFGCATFGGEGALFSAMGGSGLEEARRLVDVCIEAGAAMFDTADVYSIGRSEQILGEVLKGRRDKVIISTKTGLPLARGDMGASRARLVRAVDAALKRLSTDYIDLFQMHAFDAATPVEEVVETLDGFVRAGKVRAVGASNFAGWQLMKALAVADRTGAARYAAHEVHYSLIARDYEWDLMPLALDQNVGAIVWSPLGWGRLAGKIRRGQAARPGTRMAEAPQYAPPIEDERFFRIVDAMDVVAAETGKTHSQIAIAWLLSRPSVASVIIGARNEVQLRENLGAVGWSLTADQIKRLDAASFVMPCYPHFSYRLEKSFARLNPPPV